MTAIAHAVFSWNPAAGRESPTQRDPGRPGSARILRASLSHPEIRGPMDRIPAARTGR